MPNENAKTATKKPAVLTGVDLGAFHIKSRQPLTAVRRMFGVSLVRWNKEVGKSGMIGDVTLSMLLRLYNKNPQLLTKGVSIREFYRDIGGRNTVSPADFSLIVGRESSAYVRWLSGVSQISPILENLIERSLHLCGGDPKKAFEIIRALFQEECSARNVNPMRDRRWTGPRTKRKKAEKR